MLTAVASATGVIFRSRRHIEFTKSPTIASDATAPNSPKPRVRSVVDRRVITRLSRRYRRAIDVLGKNGCVADAAASRLVQLSFSMSKSPG